jgi:hypothetical protein
MSRFVRGLTVSCTLVVTLVVATAARAEIYRWVDEDGNVHYGDRTAATRADDAHEAVDLGVGYTPTTLSDSERSAANKARLEQQRKIEARRNAEEKRDGQQLAEREELREKQCEQDRQKLSDVTEVKLNEHGRPRIYYLTHDDGTPMKSSEHAAAVKALREKIARDC